MADYKTVVLNGDEICVELPERHCCLRNLGSEMIYASVRPGIAPDTDGVLGTPPGATDTLYDICGSVYLKGTGKVQLVGSDYNSICLGNRAAVRGGSGGSENPGADVTESDIDKMFV